MNLALPRLVQFGVQECCLLPDNGLRFIFGALQLHFDIYRGRVDAELSPQLIEHHLLVVVVVSAGALGEVRGSRFLALRILYFTLGVSALEDFFKFVSRLF